MNKKNNDIINRPLFITSCIACIVLGTLLHFAYDFFNKSFLVGLFTPVNESVWEHLKLVLIPITLFGIIYSLIYRKSSYKLNSFWYYTSISIILSMIIIPIIHYLYKLIFKDISSFFDITLYIISIIISFFYIYINMKKQYQNVSNINKNATGIIIITSLFLLFIIFTIYPPRLELFKDPTNNTFGIYLL